MRKLLLLLVALAECAHPQEAPGRGAPFTPEQRLRYYWYRTYSWQRLSLLGVDTALDQLRQPSDAWGNGVSRFAKCYGAGLGGRVVRNSIELGLGIALREDTRYRPSGRGALAQRIRYAVAHTLSASHPSGHFTPAYSRLVATVGGEFAATAWSPYSLSATDILRNIALSLAGNFPNSLLSEFGPNLKAFGRRIGRRLQSRLPGAGRVAASSSSGQ